MPIRGRRHVRFAVEDSTVEYRRHSPLPFLGGHTKVSQLLNLSRGGLQFLTDDLYDVGQRLDLKVMFPGAFKSLTIRGEVVWAKRLTDRHSYRMGARFIDPSDEDLRLLALLEEQCARVPEARRRMLEEGVARRYPLTGESDAEARAARISAEAVEAETRAAGEPAAPPRPEAPPPAPAPAPPPAAGAPAPAPQEAVAEEAAASDKAAASTRSAVSAKAAGPTEAAAPAEATPAAKAPTPPEPPKAPEPVPIPLFEMVAAVETRADATLQVQGMVRCQIVLPGITDAACFALEVHDNTMLQAVPPSFDRGDVAVFSPNVSAHSGDLAFVVTAGGGVFRQVFFDADDMVRLRPLNGWYPEQRLPRRDVQGIWKLIAKFESYLAK